MKPLKMSGFWRNLNLGSSITERYRMSNTAKTRMAMARKESTGARLRYLMWTKSGIGRTKSTEKQLIKSLFVSAFSSRSSSMISACSSSSMAVWSSAASLRYTCRCRGIFVGQMGNWATGVLGGLRRRQWVLGEEEALLLPGPIRGVRCGVCSFEAAFSLSLSSFPHPFATLQRPSNPSTMTNVTSVMRGHTKGILPAFHKFATANEKPPIIFLHGFLGSKKNFKQMANHYKTALDTTCYTLDTRNHGQSPHIPSFSYADQTHDLAHFMDREGIDKAVFIGYSMGAKIALNYALQFPERVQSLASIDNAPANKPIGPEFKSYVPALLKTIKWCRSNQTQFSSREFKQRAMTQLTENLNGDEHMGLYLRDIFEFDKHQTSSKIPLDFIDEIALDQLGEFPHYHDSQAVDTPALFLKGEQSPFIDEDGIKEIRRLFTNSTLHVIPNANHSNIVVEHQKEVVRLIEDFIQHHR